MATTTNFGITKLDNSTNQPEVLVNAALDRLDVEVFSNPSKFLSQRHSTTTGLVFGYWGGTYNWAGAFTTVTAGTVTLTASTTNYIEWTPGGAVSFNTTGFTANRLPMYEVVTGVSTMTTVTDRRDFFFFFYCSILAKSLGSVAYATLTAAEARVDSVHVTSSVSLTATRNITMPLLQQEWEVYNNTTGGQALQFIGATGTGVTVQNKQRMRIYCDGTNFVPADSSGVVQVLAFNASTTIDASLGDRVSIGALTSTITINAPTNPYVGQVMTIRFLQDATGGRTITWNAVFKKAADGAGAANQVGCTQYMYDGTSWVQIGGALAWF